MRSILQCVNPSCLSRQTVKSLAAGRCGKTEMEAVRRHLAECTRCRSAVVAAAAGVQGPGDTVLLKRPTRSVPSGLKVAAVGASLIVIGVAWRYTAPSKPVDPAAAVDGRGAESSAAAPREGGATLVTSVRVSPAALTREASLALPAQPVEAELGSANEGQPEPQVRPLTGRESAAPEAHRAMAAAPVVASTKRHALRPASAPTPTPALAPSPARAASVPRTAPPRAPLESAMPVEEFDFGIDEPTGSSDGKREQRAIRTTLD